jgi:hypothetical protein
MFNPNPDQLDVLRAAKALWGHNWKQALGDCWLVGHYPVSLNEYSRFLQQIQNQGGAGFLQHFRCPKV